MSSDPHQLASEIKRRARALGFDLVGIAPASPSRYRDYLRQWLDDGQAGTMHYLAARFEEFGDPFYYAEAIEGGHAAGVVPEEDAQRAALEAVYLNQVLPR